MNLDFDRWAERNATLWQLYLDGQLTAEQFIVALKKENSKWIPIFVAMGYQASGGAHEGTLKNAVDFTDEFINGFANGFLQDLQDKKVTDDRGAWRALLYASEGSRMAYMLGQQQAMRERGAKSWKRVLHPESSESGPCQLCVDDSMIVHSMDEAFEALHVNEVCTMSQTVDYFPTEAEATDATTPFKVSMPVPNRFPTTPEHLRKAMGALAEKVKSIVRRVAPREIVTEIPNVAPVASPEEMTKEALVAIPTPKKRQRKARGK